MHAAIRAKFGNGNLYLFVKIKIALVDLESVFTLLAAVLHVDRVLGPILHNMLNVSKLL